MVFSTYPGSLGRNPYPNSQSNQNFASPYFHMESPSNKVENTVYSGTKIKSRVENSDYFLLVRVEGTSLSELHDKNNILQQIANESSEILDLNEKGSLTLNALSFDKKENYLFPGCNKSVQINLQTYNFNNDFIFKKAIAVSF
jgi:hypothetical protein